MKSHVIISQCFTALQSDSGLEGLAGCPRTGSHGDSI